MSTIRPTERLDDSVSGATSSIVLVDRGNNRLYEWAACPLVVNVIVRHYASRKVGEVLIMASLSRQSGNLAKSGRKIVVCSKNERIMVGSRPRRTPTRPPIFSPRPSASRSGGRQWREVLPIASHGIGFTQCVLTILNFHVRDQ